jgi:protein-tyrosine-phosphatase
MAEAPLKMSAKQAVEVYSAGIKPGRKVNEKAVKTMREIGYDLSGHEPTHISHFSKITFD